MPIPGFVLCSHVQHAKTDMLYFAEDSRNRVKKTGALKLNL